MDRLLALILHLQSQPLCTAEELAAHFGLSVRTIYRDLAALVEAGVPIVAQAGIGYALAKGYHLPPLSFTPEEAGALVASGLLLDKWGDESLRAQMRSALRKVRAVLPRQEMAAASKLESRMASTATPDKPRQASLANLQRALGEQRLLRIQYQGFGEESAQEREVEPMALIHYLDRWHLIAWCRRRKGFRDFRTDRIASLSILNERFSSRADFSVEDYLATMPQPNLRAKIQFHPDCVDRARREWWLGIVAQEEGRILTLAAVNWEPLASWLLSFGGGVTVIEPESLRELVISKAREVIRHHEGS